MVKDLLEGVYDRGPYPIPVNMRESFLYWGVKRVQGTFAGKADLYFGPAPSAFGPRQHIHRKEEPSTLSSEDAA